MVCSGLYDSVWSLRLDFLSIFSLPACILSPPSDPLPPHFCT